MQEKPVVEIHMVVLMNHDRDIVEWANSLTYINLVLNAFPLVYCVNALYCLANKLIPTLDLSFWQTPSQWRLVVTSIEIKIKLVKVEQHVGKHTTHCYFGGLLISHLPFVDEVEDLI